MNPERELGPRFGCVVAGTGHYLPHHVLANDAVARRCGTDADWIQTRTGIRERRIVDSTESVGTLAYEASQRALASAGLEARELDLVIVCTITPEKAVPSTACLLQHRLGLGDRGTPAFDLAAACSGFIYGLTAAWAHMQVLNVRHALVVGVDVMSRMTNWADRNTAALLGDGAGAMVLRRTQDREVGILHTQIGADGSGHHLIHAQGGLNSEGAAPTLPPGSAYHLYMDGPKVFKLAVARMQQQVEEAIQACGMTTQDIDLLIPHQANRRILDVVAQRLNLGPERVFANIECHGNTSAASIPIAYDAARREGIILPGDLLVLVAFGAGLTWGSTVLREPRSTGGGE